MIYLINATVKRKNDPFHKNETTKDSYMSDISGVVYPETSLQKTSNALVILTFLYTKNIPLSFKKYHSTEKIEKFYPIVHHFSAVGNDCYFQAYWSWVWEMPIARQGLLMSTNHQVTSIHWVCLHITIFFRWVDVFCWRFSNKKTTEFWLLVFQKRLLGITYIHMLDIPYSF